MKVDLSRCMWLGAHLRWPDGSPGCAQPDNKLLLVINFGSTRMTSKIPLAELKEDSWERTVFDAWNTLYWEFLTDWQSKQLLQHPGDEQPDHEDSGP